MEFTFSFITSAVAILGFVVAYRILRLTSATGALRQSAIQWMLLGNWIWFLVLGLSSPPLPVALIAASFGVVLPPLILHLYFRYREKRVEKVILKFLDALIASTLAGLSIRESVKAQAPWMSLKTRFLADDLSEMFVSGKIPTRLEAIPSAKALAAQILEIQRGNYRTVERLKSLRRHYRIRERIQQKVRSAMAQSQAQSWVVWIIYLIISLWLIAKAGWIVAAKWVLISFVLLSLGSVIMIWMRRRLKWRI